MTGTVVSFKSTFGFIRPDGAGKDVFVFYGSIRAEGWKSLREGDRVEFEVAQGRKGPEAVDVRILTGEQP